MATKKFYKYVFLLGAIWNILGTLIALLFQEQIFAFAGSPKPMYMVFYQSHMLLAFVFGIGYYYVFLDIYNNTNIVKLGIIGKLAFAFDALYYHDPWPIVIGAVGDLVFVVLYALFLEHARKVKNIGDNKCKN